MSEDLIVDLFRNSVEVVLIIVGAVIMPGLIVGLIISIFQAATQINEQTLSFIPRLLVTMLTILFLSPWILHQLMSFTEELINNIASYIV